MPWGPPAIAFYTLRPVKAGEELRLGKPAAVLGCCGAGGGGARARRPGEASSESPLQAAVVVRSRRRGW